jgi:hypothetical protein
MGAAPQVNGQLTIPTLQEAATAAQLLEVEFTGTMTAEWTCGSSGCLDYFSGTITIQPSATFVSNASGIAGTWQLSSGGQPVDGGDATFNVSTDGNISVTMSSATAGFSGAGTLQSLTGSGGCAEFGADTFYVAWSASATPSSSTSLRAKPRNSKPRPRRRD